MDVTPVVPAGRQLIQSYGGGGFTIAAVRHEGSVLVLPQRTRRWSVTAFADLSADSLAPLADADPAPEVLLLGTGRRFAMIDPRRRQDLRARYGVAVECMDTTAACRTYNVLLAEERRVAAALIAL